MKTTKILFLDTCVAAGCDYLQNVCDVAINTAFKLVKSGDLFEQLKRPASSNNYESMFKMAVSVFKH